MVTLADLKKNRNLNFGKVTEAFKKKDGDDGNDDSRFWKLERDKAGNGSATIRFLQVIPMEDEEQKDEIPWVPTYSHSFKGPTGRWYIENCRSTIGEADPVNDLNRELWATKDEDKKKQASAQKRKLAYVAKILVESDSKHPECEGNVYFYKFGKKIFEKIMDKGQPTFEDEEPMDVFDFWEGASFKLRVKTVDDFPNYDSSVFTDKREIGDDDYIMEVVKKMQALGPLKQFLNPSKFKSYDELKKKLDSVLDPKATASSTKTAEDMARELREEKQAGQPKPIEAKADTKPVESKAEKAAADDLGMDDNVEDYFSKLAADD